MSYREIGLNVYGDHCEICGYGIVEVHHIDYKLHNDYERVLRKKVKANQNVESILENAKQEGFLEWSGHQLSKDDRSINLAVLCPNCHAMVHKADIGLALLKLLPERK
jgi:hypothetical protein